MNQIASVLLGGLGGALVTSAVAGAIWQFWARQQRKANKAGARLRAMAARRELVGLWPEIAFQYYVLARVAKRCGYWYPAGWCAHLAVELMLKYLLFLPQPWRPAPPWPGRGQPLTPEQIPRIHDLMKLWRRFNAAYPGNNLSSHADCVKELNRWEDIRYARLIESGATVISPTIEAAEVSRSANVGRGHDVLALDIGRLDALFRALLDFAGISRTIRGSKFMVLDGRELYEEDNPFAIRQ